MIVVADAGPGFATTDLQVKFFPVGRESGNAGIVSAGARREAVGDKAVLPLLYEGRDVELSVD